MSLMQNAREIMKVMSRTPGFDRVLEKVTLVSAAPEKLICEMKVEEQHANKTGTLHGGLTATIIDNISTMALLLTERGLPGVSVDMNITYMSPAKIGEESDYSTNFEARKNTCICLCGSDQQSHRKNNSTRQAYETLGKLGIAGALRTPNSEHHMYILIVSQNK